MSDGHLDQQALAAMVRAGQWAEVRVTTGRLARPLPPAVALVAARAAARSGDPRGALALLADAIPGAGELAGALRLEAAAVALSRGESPWRFVGELVRAPWPPEQRRAAAELLRRSWEVLPQAAVARQRAATLPRALRRELEATLALRTADRPLAFRLLRESRADAAAARLAAWLAQDGPLTAGVRLHVAEALLLAGHWREADALLAAGGEAAPAHLRGREAYLKGRAAYRLGRLAEAARHFDDALSRHASAKDRFESAVQRARIAELIGQHAAAIPFWDAARLVAPKEVEGWDGGARARAAAGRERDAMALLRRAPPPALRIAGPRLAARLIAHGRLDLARELLDRLSSRQPAVQALTAALHARAGARERSLAAIAALLATPGGGAWRSLALDLLPPPPAPAGAVAGTADPRSLAALVAVRGVAIARASFAKALAGDPAWSVLLAGVPAGEPAWDGPAHALAALGLEREAAALYPHRFPAASPVELAWSAATLARWGNGPASLAAGERLARALGDVPTELVPDELLPFLLPGELAAACADAARAAGAHPSWLAAIVRRESRFDAAARSRAGALGIAQIVPETARRLGSEPDSLWEPAYALALAARELARIEACFAGRLAVVAAAYNAGDEVVMSWLAGLGGDAGELLFTAAVPYGETAEYVLAVREGAAVARYLE